jgi:hypothetical protein
MAAYHLWMAGRVLFYGYELTLLPPKRARTQPVEEHRFTIRGEPVNWRYTRLRGAADGYAKFEPRRVLINEQLKNRQRLEVEIHEALHQAFYDLGRVCGARGGKGHQPDPLEARLPAYQMIGTRLPTTPTLRPTLTDG